MIELLKRLWNSDAVIAGIRTGASVVGVAVLAWIAKTLGVDFSDDVDAQITLGLAAIAVGVWNWVVNAASKKWPAVGWLLLRPSRAEYTKREKKAKNDDGWTRPIEVIAVTLGIVLLFGLAVALT